MIYGQIILTEHHFYSPFRNRHLLLSLRGHRVELSSKQSADFLCYFYILLL